MIVSLYSSLIKMSVALSLLLAAACSLTTVSTYETSYHALPLINRQSSVISSVYIDTQLQPTTVQYTDEDPLQPRTCPETADAYPHFTKENITLVDDAYFSYRDAWCEKLSVPYYGGIAMCDSVSVTSDNTTTIDLISARLLTVPDTPPVVAIAYFNDHVNYYINTTQKDPQYELDAGIFSSAMSVVYNQVIEFYDVDGNQQYNVGTDIIVQSRDLKDQYWDWICESPDDESMNGLKVYNATTIPSLADQSTFLDVSIQLEVTNVLGAVDGYVITPRSAITHFQVNNFPYVGFYNSTTNETSQDTYLAVETYVLSGSFNNTDQWNVAVESGEISEITSLHGIAVNNSDADMYLNWKGSVDVEHTVQQDDGNVTISTGSADIKFEISETNDHLNGFAEELYFGTNSVVIVNKQLVYYSIATPQPSKIHSIFTLGAGKAANEASNMISSKNVAIAVGIFALICGGVGISWFIYRSMTDGQKREQDLIDADAYQRLPSDA